MTCRAFHLLLIGAAALSGCRSVAQNVQCGEGEGALPSPPESCGDAWRLATTCDPWWVAAPPGACAQSLAHDPVQPYDDCTPVEGGWDPVACKLPSAGALICAANVTASNFDVLSFAWRNTCTTGADCPRTMACVADGKPGDHGEREGAQCEKTCSTTADCIRCDLKCNEYGVCVGYSQLPPQPDGGPCRADCECPDVNICEDGVCQIRGVRPSGLCRANSAGPADCDCITGTCDDRGCCMQPDGSIAPHGSPECPERPIY